MTSRPAVALLAVLAVTSPAPASERVLPDEPPELVALYRDAVATMNALPEPAYAQFTTTLSTDSGTLTLERDDGNVDLQLATGGKTPHEAVRTSYRAADALAAIALDDGARGVSRRPLFNPTWIGADAWIRRGLHQDVVPSAPEVAGTAPTVSVFSVLGYRLTEGGAIACPGGTPGVSIHFIAFRDPSLHPLTDVAIDPATKRICAVRFHVRRSGLVSFDGSVDLFFAPVATNYLITDGRIDLEAHALGLVHKRVDVAFVRSDFTFPSELPDALFHEVPAPRASPVP